MSYNSTVHCGYCSTPGHNRTTCPAFAARIEERRKEHGDDDYSVRSYDRRKERKANNRKLENKMCSYCQERGHTRASCTDYKAIKTSVIEDIALFKKAWVILINHFGMGAGAILNVDVGRYGSYDENNTSTVILTGYEWENSDLSLLRQVTSDKDDRLCSEFFTGILLKHGADMSEWQKDSKPINSRVSFNIVPTSLARHNACRGVFAINSYDINLASVISPGVPIEPPKKWYKPNSRVLKGIMGNIVRWRDSSLEMFGEDGKKFLNDVISHHEKGTLKEVFADCQEA